MSKNKNKCKCSTCKCKTKGTKEIYVAPNGNLISLPVKK